MTEIETDYEEVEIEEARPHEQQTGKYIMTVCKVCGTAFATSRKWIRKYCSRECRESLRLKVVCAHCGKTFFARRRQTIQRFCGKACRKAWWREQREAREAQTRKEVPFYFSLSQLHADQKLRAARRKAALRKADQLNAHNNVTITRRRNAEGLFVETRGRACGSAGCNRSWQFYPTI